jgi:hypothetical protein
MQRESVMSPLDSPPETVRLYRVTRDAAGRRPRSAARRLVGNALVILGLGIAIGLLTATFEIDRQERAARVAR